MTEDALRREILALGLEDDIPLWEIAEDCRAADLIAEGRDGIEVLARVLLTLTNSDEIKILAGRWDGPEPRYVGPAEAKQLLADARRYSSAEEIANDLERVYYVNVKNIAE